MVDTNCWSGWSLSHFIQNSLHCCRPLRGLLVGTRALDETFFDGQISFAHNTFMGSSATLKRTMFFVKFFADLLGLLSPAGATVVPARRWYGHRCRAVRHAVIRRFADDAPCFRPCCRRHQCCCHNNWIYVKHID